MKTTSKFLRGAMAATVLLGIFSMLNVAAAADATETATPSPSPTAGGAPRPRLSSLARVFDLRALPPTTRSLVRGTLRTHDFDWRLLLPALNEQGGERRIRIRISDTSSWGAVGLSWPAPIGMIEIHSGVRDPWWFRGILLHEVAHIVDFYYLAPRGLQDDVAALYGKDWGVVSHSFNDAFTHAFSPFTAKDATYPLDAGGVLRLRSLLGGTGPLPRKAPPALTFNALGRAPKDTPPASAAKETRS